MSHNDTQIMEENEAVNEVIKSLIVLSKLLENNDHVKWNLPKLQMKALYSTLHLAIKWESTQGTSKSTETQLELTF